MTTATLMAVGSVLMGALWALHKLGKGLTWLLETLAVVAVVFVTAWVAIKAAAKALRWSVRHWRTSLLAVAAVAWLSVWGWRSMAIGTSWAVEVVAVWWLVAWRIGELATFDALAGRHLRGWWQRWIVYAIPMRDWFRKCGLTVPDPGQAITVNVNPLRRTAVSPRVKPRRDQVPRIVGVRSGASWDEVRVKLVAGQTPEDFDESARRLAVARGVARCQVRELTPNLVSVDFQRRDLLAGIVPCQDFAQLASASGSSLDLKHVWSGRTEYGVDWHQSLVGGHTLYVGATGAGKNSHTWSPLVSIAPAIRDGLVRVSGIDPKGMELAYGRGIFTRYAVTARDALELLDELVETMVTRQKTYAGRVRTVDITADCPVELLEFDEIAALTKYTGDRKTREAIVERVSVLNTQGRALGFTVRGYVQEPNKDTVPIRDLFPRRVCLRVPTKSHVAMALGDNAWDRGAWANRIGESEAGVGYLFGEGVREPLRVRAGWVSDEEIKALESFVTGRLEHVGGGQLLQLPALVQRPAGGVA